MKKWNAIDAAVMPDGKTISLREHDGTYAIRVDGAELMSTRRNASEAKLADLACAHSRELRAARVLIGGLGFGFTLKAALAALGPDATVTVVELLAAVIDWNKDPALPLAAEAVSDPRVVLLQKDVGDVIREYPGTFDSILLDVDNGPAALSTEENQRLYDQAGVNLAFAALRPGGCLAVWSAAGDPAFEKIMRRAGFTVVVERCRAHTSSGGWHTLFIGRRRV
jgi:spermidine synthase